MRARRYILTGVTAVYCGALIGLTFVTGAGASRQLWVWPFFAFLPVGILLVALLGRRRWWGAMVFVVLGSAWIEAAQSVWMPVGYAEIIDILWASLGGATGAAVTVILTSLRVRSMRAHESPRNVAHASGREIPQD